MIIHFRRNYIIIICIKVKNPTYKYTRSVDYIILQIFSSDNSDDAEMLIQMRFSSFFLYGKKLPYVVTRDVCPSVCPSVRLSVCPSVCPSSVEISLERGCSITNMPIDLKFGTIIGGRVMHV